jgi:anti-sigma factor RsiW
MTKRCPTAFDDTLLSGYLDRELTQGDAQRVRLHLEDCATCRATLDELSRLRAASRSTLFVPVPDDQWDERPRGPLSGFARRLGWVIVIGWLTVLTGLAVWELVVSPGALGPKLLTVAAVGGPVLLFVSVLVDRLRTLETDRYRSVLK